jgi:hypothetical protein
MSYQKCSLCGEGPTIRHDTSGLCQGCKISTGLTEREAKENAIFHWRQVTGIEPGMERSEALKRFMDQVPTEWVNVTAFESKIRQHTS